MVEGEPMAHMLIGNHGSGQVAHDLMHMDQNAPGLLRVKRNRLDMRIDLAPLLRPVIADFFRPTDKTAFERFRPSHVRVMRVRAASMSRALKAAYAARSSLISGAG